MGGKSMSNHETEVHKDEVIIRFRYKKFKKICKSISNE